MRSRFIILLSVALLSHCVSKHQPSAYEPHFPTAPASHFNKESVLEIQVLENLSQLTLLQKRRLLELYQNEIRQVKTGSTRHQQITSGIQRLELEVQSIADEVKEVQGENLRERENQSNDEKSNFVFDNKWIKKEYQEAYQLWNKDQNDAALRRVDLIFKNPLFNQKSSSAEQFRTYYLKFRIAIDTGELSVANQAYQEMKKLNDCSTDTAAAGFILSLFQMTSGDAKQALALYQAQCDPDESPSNKIRRAYWEARFREASGEKVQQKFDEIGNGRMAGYYAYLAKSRVNAKLEIKDVDANARSYLSTELEFPRGVASLVLLAEERLQNRLRKDASIYLTRAAQKLRKEISIESIPSLLYVAHLLHAAGNQLEAMKIYASITTLLQEKPGDAQKLNIDFLSEMFPRPHAPLVDSLSRQWNIDPDFIYSIMRQESAFNPGAVSVADARGLMQLMPALARTLSHQWSYQSYYSDRLLFNASENLKLAVFHLHQLRMILPHIVLMSASYNAGVMRVSGWWKKFGNLPMDVFVELIPITETRNYVKLVVRNFVHYRALRNHGVVDPNLVPMQLPAYRVSPEIRG